MAIEEELKAIDNEVKEVKEAEAFADASPNPPVEELGIILVVNFKKRELAWRF